jgi:hypothetical protein
LGEPFCTVIWPKRGQTQVIEGENSSKPAAHAASASPSLLAGKAGSGQERSMTKNIQVGTILMSGWPQPFDLQDSVQKDHYSGIWSVVETIDGIALDPKIRNAGWNFFFIASEVKSIFFGAIGAGGIERALRRILGKVKQENFNGLEVTGIVAKRFLGLPYAVVTAHSRHLQRNCYLDGPEARRLSHLDTAKT